MLPVYKVGEISDETCEKVITCCVFCAVVFRMVLNNKFV